MAHEALKIELAEAIFHVEDGNVLAQVASLLQANGQATTTLPKSIALTPPIPRQAGWGKDIVGDLSDDFDEPLDDLKEYMF